MLENNINKIKIKIEFYIISLWLLFLFVIILTIDLKILLQCCDKKIFCIDLLKKNLTSLISFILFSYSMFLFKKMKHFFNGTKQLPTRITNIEEVDSEHLTFLTTYIIPLVCIPITEKRYLIVFIALIIVIGAISIKTNLFYANPTLALLGYHVYKIDTDDGVIQKIVLSKDELKNGTLIQYIQIDDKTYYARRCKE